MARIRGQPGLEKLADHGYGMPEAQSARLMGAHTIVTGLSADIASALVAQDLDLGAIAVAGDLQAGIEDAVRLLG